MKKSNFIKCYFCDWNLLFVFLWMGVIFYFSSLQGKVAVSNPSFWFYVERKGAHIGEYFILTLLFINFFKKYFTHKLNIILWAGGLALLYAFSDEYHQSFVFGREGKISDVGFDLIGITLAGLLTWFWFKFKKTLSKT